MVALKHKQVMDHISLEKGRPTWSPSAQDMCFSQYQTSSAAVGRRTTGRWRQLAHAEEAVTGLWFCASK